VTSLIRSQADKDHDTWFTDQVDLALKEADDPDTVWVEHSEVHQKWQNRRATVLQRLAKRDKTA
jgi:basic membrane lipoprotein Med (substrate-binding protein (PBP1-ABC) superfamily)